MKHFLLFLAVLSSGMAPVAAQMGNCDSLQILDTEINPFDINQILIRSTYSDFDHFISYPGFSLVDDEEYILALEEVDYFGLGTEQVHILDILDLDVQPGTPINATLELWSSFFSDFECSEQGGFVLWPEQECVPLELSLSLFDGDSIGGDLSLIITDESGAVVISESAEIDTLADHVTWDMCLESGCNYQLEVLVTDLSGPGLSFHLNYKDFLAVGASGIIESSGQMVRDFNLYSCETTGVAQIEKPEWSIFPNPAYDQITINLNADPFEKYNLEVREMSGKRIVQIDQLSTQKTINCSGWSNGIYLLTITDSKGLRSNQRLVVAR